MVKTRRSQIQKNLQALDILVLFSYYHARLYKKIVIDKTFDFHKMVEMGIKFVFSFYEHFWGQDPVSGFSYYFNFLIKVHSSGSDAEPVWKRQDPGFDQGYGSERSPEDDYVAPIAPPPVPVSLEQYEAELRIVYPFINNGIYLFMLFCTL